MSIFLDIKKNITYNEYIVDAEKAENMKLIKLKDFNRIYSVSTLLKEFRSLFGKSKSDYEDYLEKERYYLRILDTVGIAKALHYQQFEKLENEELYSIRYVSKHNPRILFAVYEDDVFILLSCCDENKTSDYKGAIELAKGRLKELRDGK